jgi:2-polyprenyl-3-methyl-5-hydroxy-6-metoxy-1,4-benzoquinol methylase
MLTGAATVSSMAASRGDELLSEQARYYRARAPEYDDWFFRRGRYDIGPEGNARWFADVEEVERALEAFEPRGDVLELACGTGLWTRRLARHAATVTALDASAEVLDLNRARVGEPSVEYVQADVFEWQPERAYDVCFFGLWLSHVPEERFELFWALVGRAVAPGGRVFLVDSGRRGDRAHAQALDEEVELRQLSDGREFRIVKRYLEPAALERRLAGLGWDVRLRRTANGALVYGGGRHG